jgi:hypothetical protein
MTTKDELQHLQQSLAYALKQAEIRRIEASNADTTYSAALSKVIADFEAANPDLVSRRDATRQAAQNATIHASILRERAKQAGSSYFEFVRDDSKPVEGFSLSRDKEVVYDYDELFDAAIKRAPWLLRLDDKAIRSFALNNCVESGEKGYEFFTLPRAMRQVIPIDIDLARNCDISDKILLKIAPETEPPERWWYTSQLEVIRNDNLTPEEAKTLGYTGPFINEKQAQEAAVPF